jgi:hypothetical protein
MEVSNNNLSPPIMRNRSPLYGGNDTNKTFDARDQHLSPDGLNGNHFTWITRNPTSMVI